LSDARASGASIVGGTISQLHANQMNTAQPRSHSCNAQKMDASMMQNRA
jgi:hypothetical protein